MLFDEFGLWDHGFGLEGLSVLKDWKHRVQELRLGIRAAQDDMFCLTCELILALLAHLSACFALPMQIAVAGAVYIAV